ncbi:T9SS type A sorting domain-containing protein [candidate division KSB1 bacterium]|nr:T9SS type A sorting domain-containing protein [candidate division KSB1 bacterium]
MAAGLSFTPINEVVADSLTADFKLENLAFGDYYIFCYLDADSSGSFDLGEPFAETYLDEISLGWGQDTTGIELYLAELGTGVIKGSITYDGTERGAMAAVAAGLSATPLTINLGVAFGAGLYPYTLAGLAPGFYTVLGKIIDMANPPEEIFEYFEPPFGYYIDDFIYIEKGDTVKNIDFVIEDTTTSAITGTIYAPEEASGEVYIFALGLSISPFSKAVLPDAGVYEINNLGQGKYIVAAFMDVNGDSTFNLNEPVAFTDKLITVYSNSTTADINLHLKSQVFTSVPTETADLSPMEFELLPNYPNPFNPATTIKYQLPKNSFVSIKIYNVMGKEIVTLVNEEVDAGFHQVVWDARDVADLDLSSGVYIYHIQAGDFMESRKMMLIR